MKKALENEGWTMPNDAYEDLIREPIIQTFLERHNVKLILFDTENPIIHSWKK